jgi:plastocyanin
VFNGADRPAGLGPLRRVLLLTGLLLTSQSLVTHGADDIAASAAAPSSSPVQCLTNETDAVPSPVAVVGDEVVAPPDGVSDDPPADVVAACQVSGVLPFLDDASEVSVSASPIVIEAREFGFGPGAVTISSAGPTTIELHDTGIVPHNLTVDELGIQIVAAAGRTATATFQDLAPGTYEFYCSISGHRQAGMAGTLLVQ